MTNYCIMNIKKQRRSAVFGLQVEANRRADDGREFDASDIDKSRTKDNYYLQRCDHWNAEITKRIKGAGCRERKDSVVLLTAIYTASPEWFSEHTPDEWRAYFADCLKFHEKEYGRCINAVVHLDEGTPHMQVASVPIIADERGNHLSAKMIVGGRDDMRLRQDRFADEVGRVHDMERGERRDPAELKRHTTKREWQMATQDRRLQEILEAITNEDISLTIAQDNTSLWREQADEARQEQQAAEQAADRAQEAAEQAQEDAQAAQERLRQIRTELDEEATRGALMSAIDALREAIPRAYDFIVDYIERVGRTEHDLERLRDQPGGKLAEAAAADGRQARRRRRARAVPTVPLDEEPPRQSRSLDLER